MTEETAERVEAVVQAFRAMMTEIAVYKEAGDYITAAQGLHALAESFDNQAEQLLIQAANKITGL